MLIGLRPLDRRAASALEFALIAPVIALLIAGVLDITRGLIAWERVTNAASAIAQAAEKLSVTSGSLNTSLTATQMQAAMSTIYAEIPSLGQTSGTATFSVTLTSVVYVPTCAATSGCGAQAPYVLWSSYLTEGGAHLIATPSSGNALLRACGSLSAVASFPNDSTQLTKMLNPILAGGQSMTLMPQLVADVEYVFTPMFSTFLSQITFRASAVAPAPLGATDQSVTFNTAAPTGNVVSCTLPS